MKHTTPDNLIEKIDSTEIRDNTKPVEYIVAELRQFDKALTQLGERFVRKGVTEEFINVAKPLADELQERQSEWLTGRFVSPEIKKEWESYSAEGYDLCDSLKDDLEMAYHGDKEAMRTLLEIDKGKGPEDMLQDIPHLIHLAEKDLPRVSQVGITQEFLDESKAFGKKCADIFASTIVTDDDVKEIKEARDKAKSFALEYLSLIRFYADRIFRKEPELREKFVSSYDSERHQSYK